MALFDYANASPDILRDIAGYVIGTLAPDEDPNNPNLAVSDPRWQKIAEVMGLASGEEAYNLLMENRATGPQWGDRFEGDEFARETYLRERPIWQSELSEALGIDYTPSDTYGEEFLANPYSSAQLSQQRLYDQVNSLTAAEVRDVLVPQFQETGDQSIADQIGIWAQTRGISPGLLSNLTGGLYNEQQAADFMSQYSGQGILPGIDSYGDGFRSPQPDGTTQQPDGTGGSSADPTYPKIYDPSVLPTGSSMFGIPYAGVGSNTGGIGAGSGTGGAGTGGLLTDYFGGNYGTTNYFGSYSGPSSSSNYLPAVGMAGLSALGSNMATDFGSLLSGLFGAGTNLYMNRLNVNDREAAQAGFRDLVNTGMNRIDEGTNFTPFTITGASGTGSAMGTDGRYSGFNMNYTPQALADIQLARDTAARAAGYSQAINAPNFGYMNPQGLLTAQQVMNTTNNVGRGEGQIYQMLEAMQQPDRERERLALRDELLGQGRLGTQTAAYGGTPEELARAKAVEEARATNAFNAFNLAGQEQQRLAQQALQAYGLGESSAGRVDQFNLGLGGLRNSLFGNQVQQALGQGQLANEYYRSSFLPQQQLLDEMGLGADLFDIAQRGNIYGAQAGAGLFEGLLSSEANFMGEYLQNKQRENEMIRDILLGTQQDGSSGGIFGGLLDRLFGSNTPNVPGADAYLPGALPR